MPRLGAGAVKLLPQMVAADLLVALDGQRQETLKVLDGCTDGDLEVVENESGWSVRRILAHLAAAELGQADLIRRASDGEQVHMTAEERQAFISVEIARADGFGVSQLRERLIESRKQLRDAFAQLQEDDLDRAIRWPEWPARTIRSSIPYILEHEDSHLDQLRRALERRD